jgi:RNA polymerase sigma-B factor
MTTSQHGRIDRDTATGRLLGAYRDQGDARARDRLVELYMPLVEALAHRHDRRWAEHDDLVQAGSIGLLGAIERFDPRLGEEFAAFAVPTIVGEIKRHLRDRTDMVRLPRRLHEANVRLPRAREELTARLGRAPNANELAEAVGVSPGDLARLESTAGEAVDEAAPENGSAELDATEQRLLLTGAFRSLDETDRTIIYLRFIRERSRREVAEELKMSQSALARRMTAALAKLREELEGRAFERGAPAPASGAPRRPDPPPVPPRKPSAGRGSREGEPVPPPTPDGKGRAGHSGRLMLRMPQSLHAELVEAAEREEVSLNQFITNTLSAAVSWHSEGERPTPTPRWLPAAVVTNIVVVVIAGLVALALLLVAWLQGW